ncbi:MAG TPA: hypothetical protein VFA54_01420 [Bryobacterales bacterium]|jgi:hypothetical protein|nr:hypothetical protein [Bryobacterales bacterium]
MERRRMLIALGVAGLSFLAPAFASPAAPPKEATVTLVIDGMT